MTCITGHKDLVDVVFTVITSSSDDQELVDIASIVPNNRILIFYMGEVIETLTKEKITVQNIVSSSLAKGVTPSS